MPRRRGAHRGRDAAHRGLRRHAAPAALLRLHRAAGPTSACSTGPSCGCSRSSLIVVAIVGKLFGATIAARLTGFDWRSSAVIGTLMNTRGLTELIVLNLALEKGVISEALFAMLVIMALVTTFMAGPVLKLLDPKNELGAPVEEELEEARRCRAPSSPRCRCPSSRSWSRPQSDGALAAAARARRAARALRAAARADPRATRAPAAAARRARGGLQTENRLLPRRPRSGGRSRDELMQEGIAARAVAFISTDPGADLARLAQSEEVDLVLMDGRRPLLGEGVPRGDVGTVLRGGAVRRRGARGHATSRRCCPAPERGVLVPFGGAEHDWAALELGAWLASATGVPLTAARRRRPDRRARAGLTRCSATPACSCSSTPASRAEPVVAEPRPRGRARGRRRRRPARGRAVRALARGGPRARPAPRSPARRPRPVLFVRRGTRPGALAPRGDVTRFSWSGAGAGGGFTPGGSLE